MCKKNVVCTSTIKLLRHVIHHVSFGFYFLSCVNKMTRRGGGTLKRWVASLLNCPLIRVANSHRHRRVYLKRLKTNPLFVGCISYIDIIFDGLLYWSLLIMVPTLDFIKQMFGSPILN